MEENEMNNLFKTKLNAACFVLIPPCIGINYLGKLFASVLKLPLWLDSIGTCIGGILGGPIIGGICGAANNLIYGFTTGDSITLVYALTSLGIGVVVGIMARLGRMNDLPGALLAADDLTDCLDRNPEDLGQDGHIHLHGLEQRAPAGGPQGSVRVHGARTNPLNIEQGFQFRLNLFGQTFSALACRRMARHD